MTTSESWVDNWLNQVLEYYEELGRMPNVDDLAVIHDKFNNMGRGEKLDAFDYLLKHALLSEEMIRRITDGLRNLGEEVTYVERYAATYGGPRVPTVLRMEPLD